jgi:outer membrane protein
MDVEQQILLRVVQAYVGVLRAQAFLELRRSSVRLRTEELRAMRDRFDVGEVTRTDVALTEAALASAQSGVAAEEGNLVRAIEEFRAAVGRAPGPLETPSPANITQSIPEAKALAQRLQPALEQARHQVAAAEIAILQAEASLSPTVSVDGRVGLDDDLNESAGLGVTAQGTFYQGGRIASQIREVMAQRDQSRAGLLVTAQAADQDVGNAYANLEVSRASQAAFDAQSRAAQVAFEGVREEARLGARTTLDVLDAEQDLLDARANAVSAELDEITASYQLLAAMGLLTAENLGLNVQIYDPTAYYDLVDDAPAALSEQGEALDRVLQAIGD